MRRTHVVHREYVASIAPRRMPWLIFLLLGWLRAALPFLVSPISSLERCHVATQASFPSRIRKHVKPSPTCLDSQRDVEESNDRVVEYVKSEMETKIQSHKDRNNDVTLPTFMDDSASTVAEQQPAEQFVLDETQRRIEQQQEQIDLLLQLVQQQQTKSNAGPTLRPSEQSPALAPLKAMLFIDGTWLYYSIHERQENFCPIVRAYGLGWQTRYQFDWAALPRVICEQIQQQEINQGWSSSSSSSSSATDDRSTAASSRPIEVVRALVFTSVKRDTPKSSNRLRMYDEMSNCNYDVHIMETTGPGEKCVDIQLAVEMMHFATVPNAYDIAILLSGDKDFLPALIRTRQKGRKVCIVSMRSGCNRDLHETPNVKDYDVVWIEDFLDQLIVPRQEMDKENAPSLYTFMLMKVISDFIQESGLESVSSRDIGKYLKRMQIGGKSMLDVVKHSHGGLFQFLRQSGCFEVRKQLPDEERAVRRLDPLDKTFWVSVYDGVEAHLLAEAKRTRFSDEEKEFFDSYSTEALQNDDDDGNSLYLFSRWHAKHVKRSASDSRVEEKPEEVPEDLNRDFTNYKVVELKEMCRERGLPVSGTKAVLIQRIQDDVMQKFKEEQKQQKARTAMKRPMITGRINSDAYTRIRLDTEHDKKGQEGASEFLERLVCEFVHASGGVASSREIGRFLAASAGSGGNGGHSTALSELKSNYGSLAAFVASHEDVFEKIDNSPEDSSSYEFRVSFQKV